MVFIEAHLREYILIIIMGGGRTEKRLQAVPFFDMGRVGWTDQY
jgi:hypothetical protein